MSDVWTLDYSITAVWAQVPTLSRTPTVPIANISAIIKGLCGLLFFLLMALSVWMAALQCNPLEP